MVLRNQHLSTHEIFLLNGHMCVSVPSGDSGMVQGGAVQQHGVAGQGGAFQWGGCSDDVAFSLKLTERFCDAGERGRHVRSLLSLHNNRVGRLVGGLCFKLG